MIGRWSLFIFSSLVVCKLLTVLKFIHLLYYTSLSAIVYFGLHKFSSGHIMKEKKVQEITARFLESIYGAGFWPNSPTVKLAN